MRDTYLSKYYWRIKQRRGTKKAIVALARKILVILYHMLKNRSIYCEDKFEAAKQKSESVRIHKLAASAKKLGFSLVQLVEAS